MDTKTVCRVTLTKRVGCWK